jgi:glutamate racemase
MNAEIIVKLMEEMMDIKVQQKVEVQLQGKPELARFLEEKRVADLRRLELVKLELARQLSEALVKVGEQK